MAINLKFDLIGNPEPPSIVLANRNGNKLGQLNVNVESVDVSDKFNDASEFSFTLNKYIDGELTPLWDKVVDFKLVYCPEWDMWFEIKVELDEATETVKTVYCTQLGQAELSQIMIYNTEINTEADIEREDYKTSILYDESNLKASILHRLLEKAPHYSIVHVDESIQRIQRQFSFDGVSICDAFNEIAEEIGCLFVYNSNSQAGGKPNRTISVYDLQQNCNNKDCKHRGEFAEKCPKCGSTDITYGYGEDTTIFVTADELATEGIQLVTDTDSVKNCFKLEAGDDLMTATIRNCNPNGSDYIWYFSDSMKEDMSKELVDRIEGYDELYKEHYNNHISQLNGTLVSQYNNLVAKYDDYYNTKSTCLDCDTEGGFEEQCPNLECNSKNILTGQKLQTIPTTITGYSALMTAYYNTIDLLLYLESGLMPKPDIEVNKTDAKEQLQKLIDYFGNPNNSVAVNVKEIENASEPTAKSAVLSMAKVIVKSTYKVEIKEGTSSLSNYDDTKQYRVWTGKFIVTNYSDETDTATIDVNEPSVSVEINNATEKFIQQKIDKALNKANTDDYSITGLFSKDYDVFCEELHKYALNPLDSFSKACDTCLSILTEQGVGDDGNDENNAIEKAEKKALYDNLYKPYFDKQQAINDEIKVREDEIAIIEGIWDKSDESNPKCTTKGLQQYIEDCQKEIQDILNFENHLGEDLWLEFCAYRREDKYSNSNYISDGLDNAELFKKANEFIGVAEEEIFKSAELQHSISANLNNLLALPKFKPLLKSFKTGNWIRVRVDDRIFKLRLLEYNFGYGDSQNISVEFSDVTKIKNGMTDVQDVFEQASSMASSYDSIQRQAQKGNVARSTIDQWIVDGLNSANVQIQSNDSEEIVLTQSGLLARSYDDITGTYSPEQFKLTHNIMAYTDDNWKTVSAALGKHNYKYYKDGNLVDAEGYGLSAKFAQAAHIIGSQIIGGEIVSSNYKPQTQGTHINLLNGEFDFAGGKIVYDINDDEPEKSTLTLKGVTIQWDSLTDKPTIENIDGLSDIKNDIRVIEQGLQATTINGQYVISPHIVGGDLKIVGNNGTTSAQISNVGVLTATGANITGNITATSLTLDGATVPYDKIDNKPTKLSEFENDLNIATTDYVKVETETDETTGITTTTTIVGDKTYTTYTSSDASYLLTNIGMGSASPSEDDITNAGYTNGYFKVSKEGLLTANNAIIWGTIYATDGKFSGEIEADSLTLRNNIQLGNDTDGYHTWISTNGILSTENANINGTINSINGNIGGWQISEDGLSKNTVLFTTSDDAIMPSLVDTTVDSPIRISIGTDRMARTETLEGYLDAIDTRIDYDTKQSDIGDVYIDVRCQDGHSGLIATDIEVGDNGVITFELHVSDTTAQWQGAAYDVSISYTCSAPTFGVLEDGSVYANAAQISGTISASIVQGSDIYGSTIEGGSLLIGDEDGYHAWISEDGVLNAKGAIIEGAIYTTDGGLIGGWNIDSNGLSADDNKVGLFSGLNWSKQSLVSSDASPVRFYAGDNTKEETVFIEVLLDDVGDCTAVYTFDGCDAIELVDGHWENDLEPANYSINIDKNTLIITASDPMPDQVFFYFVTVRKIKTNFVVLKDGSLYASAVNLVGQIISDKGRIGGWDIDSNGILSEYFEWTSGVCTDVQICGMSATRSDSFKMPSLVNSGKYSYPRFYAGCGLHDDGETYTQIPNDTKNTDFVVLEDGSMYARAIEIIDYNEYSGDTYLDLDGLGMVVTNHLNTGNEATLEVHRGGSRRVDGVIYGQFAIDTNHYLRIAADRGGELQGTWSTDAPLATDSDINLKHDIVELSDKYDAMFDTLQPVCYKYNNGTSGRTHTGFIAQDVVASMEQAQLTTNDVAAVCRLFPDSEDEERWAIRYEEFVAINTWQIQKLKRRVEELEEKLKALE